ncbi:rCG63342 [Rattus norvegicus]|uniref:RCG63342 n=1 Tax=Rattus norvegicus TaxID=10116 RepID=A6J724_RAT|nr:rCG63342 [Rattus norvegicus]
MPEVTRLLRLWSLSWNPH